MVTLAANSPITQPVTTPYIIDYYDVLDQNIAITLYHYSVADDAPFCMMLLGGQSALAALGAPLGRPHAQRMRSIGGRACTGREHENWSNTYAIMNICEKALGVSW